MGKARVNVIEIWLVAVKIYGKSPIKFEKIINKKKANKYMNGAWEGHRTEYRD